MARHDEQVQRQADTAYVIAEMQQTLASAQALVRQGAISTEQYYALCDQIDRGLAAAEYSGRDEKRGRR